MEDDKRVRKLVEMIFDKHFGTTAEARAPDSSVPDYFLTNDFPQKLRYVLFTRRLMLCMRWRKHFDACVAKILPCHKAYIAFVLSTCHLEHYFNPTVFDSFISVCSLVGYLNLKTLKQTGVDFRDLNYDIVMEFYESVIKKTFQSRGGFQRLVEYILNHKYLKWNLSDVVSPGVPTSPACITEKFTKELNLEHNSQKSTKLDKDKVYAYSVSLAEKVLAKISVELPTLPSYPDLIQKLVAYRRKEKNKTAKLKTRTEAALHMEHFDEVWEGCSDSNSNSKRNPAAEQKEDIADYKDICSDSDSKTNHKIEPKEDIAEYEVICSNSNPDSEINRASEQKEDIAEYEVICSNSNPDPEINRTAEQKENIVEYEDICSNSDSKNNHTSEQKKDIAKYTGMCCTS